MNLDYNKQDAIPKPISPTTVAALEYNQIAGSLMHTQNAAGLTADANDLTQITTAINKLGAAAGMPSSVYEDLTLGASGSTYTATANGWFYLNKSGNAGEYNIITNNSNGLQTGGIQVAGQHRVPPMPVLKGDIISISYTSTLAVNMFRFIYAEGSKSEAN